jgi:hypothetical protein
MPYCLVLWMLVGRLLFLRDWELVSRYKWFGWLWCLLRRIGDEGYLTDLSLESGRPITFDSRSRVSVLIQVCFGLSMVFFLRWTRGREVVEAE